MARHSYQIPALWRNAAGIYHIENTANGHGYFGSAINLAKRFKRHWQHLRRGVHFNRNLQRAWDRDGEAAFRFRVLAICEPTMLRETERALLSLVHRRRECYNMSSDPLAPMTGRRLSPEARAKISAANKGRQLAPEQRERYLLAPRHMTPARERQITMLAELRRGAVVSAETRAKLSAAKVGSKGTMTGRKLTPEQRAKIGAAHKGKRLSEEHKARISAARIDKPLSASHRAAIGRAHLGKTHTDAHRAALSAALKAYHARARMSGNSPWSA